MAKQQQASKKGTDKNRTSRKHLNEGRKMNKYQRYRAAHPVSNDKRFKGDEIVINVPKPEPEVTMAQALEDPKHQPTAANLERVNQNDRPRPILIRGVVCKSFPNLANEDNGFFFVRPDDWEQAQKADVYCQVRFGRTLVAERYPRFSDKRSSTPRIDDEIVAWALLEKRNGREQFRALRWGFASEWDMAALVIKSRFTYRCVERRWENGRMTREKILVETYDKAVLASEFPRELGKTDPLQPEQKFNGCSIRRSWERRNASCNWHPCADPRPLPKLALTPIARRPLEQVKQLVASA